MNYNTYESFHNYLNEIITDQIELSELLLQKVTAVKNNDIDALEEILKKEQVFVLKSKGFDINIQKFKKELSLKGQTLKQMINEMPDDYVQAFKTACETLEATVSNNKALNENCQELTEDRLYTLRKKIDTLEKSGNNLGYGKDTNQKSAPKTGILSKTI